MSEPLAYFLTWRTYGTWLHGDPRGSVDWRHNGYETPQLDASRVRAETSRDRMRHSRVELNKKAREIVAGVIRRHCDIRGWELHELAVGANHVHVVVANAGIRPEAMVSQFKAYATRHLRQAGLAPAGGPVWAEGGSTRYLWKPRQVNAACAYVREGQSVHR